EESSSLLTFETKVYDLFSPYGLDYSTAQRVARCIHDAAGSKGSELGEELSSFILKFGEGMEPISIWRAYASAATIAISYFVGGLIPMVNAPYPTLIEYIDPIFRDGQCHPGSLCFHRSYRRCASGIWCAKGVFNWLEEGMDLVNGFCI